MPTPIRGYIDNLELPALTHALDEVQCDATCFRGTIFRLNGCEGCISYNELVRTVYEKAKLHSGELKGKDWYNQLKTVERLSDEVVATKPVWVKVAAKIINFFTNWKTHSTLLLIKDMSGKNSLASYFMQHSSEIMQLMKTLGYPVTPQDITSTAHYLTTNGKSSQTVTVKIKDYTIPQILCSKTKNLRTQFEEIKNLIRNSYPHLITARGKLDSFVYPLCYTAGRHFSNGTTKIQFNIDPRLDDQQRLLLDIGCTLELTTVYGERSSLRLPTYRLSFATEPNYLDLLNAWKAAIDQQLPPFLRKPQGRARDPFEDIFRNFFNADFGASSGAYFRDFFGGYAPEEASKTVPIEKDLKDIETLINEPGTLCNLYKQRKYDNLKEELRKAFKKASLLYHPDRMQKPGITDQQKKEAEEKFKQFGTSLERVKKTLERM